MRRHYTNAIADIGRFLHLWCRVASGVAVLVGLQVLCMGAGGYRYVSKSSICSVNLADFSTADDGKLSTRILHVRERNAHSPSRTELVLPYPSGTPPIVNLRGGETPHRIAISCYETLAISTCHGSIYLCDLSRLPTTETVQIQPSLLEETDDRTIDGLVFSPNGQYLAARSDRATLIWDTEHKGRADESRLDTHARFLCFLADSSGFLEYAKGSVRVRELPSGGIRHQLLAPVPIVDAAVSPDSRLVLLATEKHEIAMRSLKGGQLLWTRFGVALRGRICVSRRFAAFVGRTGVDLVFCDANTGEPVDVIRGHKHLVIGLTFVGDNELCSWDMKNIIRLSVPATGPHQLSARSIKQPCLLASSARRFLGIPR